MSAVAPTDFDLDRIRIEDLQPCGSREAYCIKRTLGEPLCVSANIFTDGIDPISAVFKVRPCSSQQWIEVPMAIDEHDVAAAQYLIEELCPHEFTVAAWIDTFEGWRAFFKRKLAVGQEVVAELEAGAEILESLCASAKAKERTFLKESAALFRKQDILDFAISRAESDELKNVVSKLQEKRCYVEHRPFELVVVDRAKARFGTWYEMFPRSAGTNSAKGATFAEAARRLPDIAQMGFDTLYLPPIHPIGITGRKGANDTPTAGPKDPGSPWAIGSSEGGHKSVHPELGSLEDFERFAERAQDLGLEIALDMAFHCSPDHPYVSEHPEWFYHRPDGTIRPAENPPFVYEDIYPFDFESRDWKGLWVELASIVRFWAERGIRIFRVDNPHTKPFGFWRWIIKELRDEYPDIVFLGEAFTRPNVMYALSKLGFTQSYTYFTWRDSAWEFTKYLTELAHSEVRHYFRPNFFTNTHDVLSEALQYGGRPAFLNRLVLAGTLSPSYGMYSGYELCENDALPGTVEYRDSEKFQIKPRNWNKPGNIKHAVRRLNMIRHSYPALQFLDNVAFCRVDNEQLLAFVKAAPDTSDSLLVVVSFDPWERQGGNIEVPLEAFGIEPGQKYRVTDLLNGSSYDWRDERNYVELDPRHIPAHIFTLEAPRRKEDNAAAK